MSNTEIRASLHSIINAEVIQICFGRHQIAINLSTRIAIVIESVVSFIRDNIDLINSGNLECPMFDRMLSMKINEVLFVSDSEILFLIGDEDRLKLTQEPPDFESITVVSL